MASGRVGGTRSKIRGQVGDVIYQVVRNDDGSYTQISYGKPEDVTQTITPRLQAQRMCTSVIEALMRDLKPIGTICMQSAANKSKSLNAFSSFNLQLIARDCQSHWYSGNQFYYPKTGNIGTPSEQMGGRFMLSSGTWPYNAFDGVSHLIEPWRVWANATMFGKRFCGLRFRLLGQPETLANFYRRHYMTSLDTICFACFHDWIDYESTPDDPIYCTRHSYMIIKLDSSITPESIVTPELLKNLFKVDSDWDIFQQVSDDGLDYYIGLLIDNENLNAYFYTYGAFTISMMEGKKKISSCQMSWDQDYIDRYLVGHAPADVMGTWMGEPSLVPYPSPFG